jgi:hypothetical protein
VNPILQTQLLDPTTDCELLGQFLQVATAVAPVSAEYVLAMQSVQPALPGFALYVPAPQAAHAPPSGPEKPATHTQSLCASLPVAACEELGQVWQVPPAVEYVLTLQSRHCSPDVVDLPAIHCVQLLAPEAEIFPAAQLLQEVAPS